MGPYEDSPSTSKPHRPIGAKIAFGEVAKKLGSTPFLSRMLACQLAHS